MKLESLQKAVADAAAFVMKLEEKQTSQDTEMIFLRRKLEAMIDAEIPQPIPRRRFKVAVSKRATYLDPEDKEPVEEIPPKKEGPKEPPLALESFGETSSTIPNPPPPIPKKTIPPVNAEPSSPATPKAPPEEPTFMKRRLDGKSQQQEIEVAVQGQATVGTQEEERAATQGRVADGGHMVGRRGHAGEDGQDHISGSQHRVGHTEESRSTFAQSEGYHIERLCRKERDRKDANAFHQQHPPSFSEEIAQKLRIVDRAMWAEKAVAQFSRIFVKRKGEAVERELSSKKQTAQTSGSQAGQGRALNAEKLDIGQMTVLMGWCVTGVNVQNLEGRQQANVFALNPEQAQVPAGEDIPLSSVLRRVCQIHSSHKTRIVRQEDRQHDSRMCRT
ncbi:hypothetical protein ACLOJK_038623 [Asimina triloba]